VVTRGGVTFRDVEYRDFMTVVELDGRLAHDTSAAAWSDLVRDVETAVLGAVTVRVRWVHVLGPCRTAEALGRLLVSRGWLGTPRRCGPTCGPACTVTARLGSGRPCRGGISAPGAWEAPGLARPTGIPASRRQRLRAASCS
jgi:hypothetical protein